MAGEISELFRLGTDLGPQLTPTHFSVHPHLCPLLPTNRQDMRLYKDPTQIRLLSYYEPLSASSAEYRLRSRRKTPCLDL